MHPSAKSPQIQDWFTAGGRHAVRTGNMSWRLDGIIEANRSQLMIAYNGFHEYHHPLTGDGLRCADFSWTVAVAIDLLQPP